MDDYAGRVLADRYRLPLPPSDEYELAETRAFDTYSGQEVLVRQVPLPEVVDAEVVDADGDAVPRRVSGRSVRKATDPAVRRAIEAAQSAAQIPDHPRLDQVFDVFAEAGSLWIVSELVAARPLAALLAERPLNPFRAAEIASDVLAAVRVLHGHGWTHRNITVRTVLVCDDGRVVLTGLAAGAAEEALCGYAPVPVPERPDQAGPGRQGHHEPESYEPGRHGPESDDSEPYGADPYGAERPGAHALDQGGEQDYEQGYGAPGGPRDRPGPGDHVVPPQGLAGHGHEAPGLSYDPGVTTGVPGGPGRAALETARAADAPYDDGASSGTSGAMPRPPRDTSGIPAPYGGRSALPGGSAAGDIRAARAGAIAAYRAGARAAARAHEDQGPGAEALPPSADRDTDATGVAGATDTTGTGGQGVGSGADITRRGEGTDASARHVPEQGRPDRPSLESAYDPAPGTVYDSWGAQEDRAPSSGGEPDWWDRPRPFGEADADEDDDPPTPYRPRLSGSWHDGPTSWNDSSGSLPAAGGGGSGRTGAGSGTGMSAGTGGGAQRYAAALPAVPEPGAGTGRWDDIVASGSLPAYRGPATPLAAERARQARIAVVGAVTERWAPEQAGPVHENWQLAPPIGPATDLWALGALLYRAVQGHAPYPEENAAELVQLVCAEPPAFAEECGPLRPVVESLLRQDPTERPDFEELRGWLRSLIRSAPEPEAGLDVVPLPADETRLPIVRRRGELVRKRWWRGRDRDLGHGRHRHRKGKERAARAGRDSGAGAIGMSGADMSDERTRQARFQQEATLPYGDDGRYPPGAEEAYARAERLGASGRPDRAGGADRGDRDDRMAWSDREERSRGSGRSGQGRGPRALGRTLLLLILLLLAAAIAYAVLFMPKNDASGPGSSVSEASPGASAGGAAPGGQDPGRPSETTGPGSADAGSGGAEQPNASAPQTSDPAVNVADGYVLRKDREGFQIAVDEDWQRRPINDSGQVRYEGGDFTLIVVPGRDSVADNGADPLAYQRDKEREIQPYRDSSWAEVSGERRVDVGRQAMAEGRYTWQDSSGRPVYVRNLAMVIGGRYHVIQVIGPEGERDKVDEMYQQAVNAYRMTG
ncbi:protein kinase [Streptomyces sp. NPDC004749]